MKIISGNVVEFKTPSDKKGEMLVLERDLVEPDLLWGVSVHAPQESGELTRWDTRIWDGTKVRYAALYAPMYIRDAWVIDVSMQLSELNARALRAAYDAFLFAPSEKETTSELQRLHSDCLWNTAHAVSLEARPWIMFIE